MNNKLKDSAFNWFFTVLLISYTLWLVIAIVLPMVSIKEDVTTTLKGIGRDISIVKEVIITIDKESNNE